MQGCTKKGLVSSTVFVPVATTSLGPSCDDVNNSHFLDANAKKSGCALLCSILDYTNKKATLSDYRFEFCAV